MRSSGNMGKRATAASGLALMLISLCLCCADEPETLVKLRFREGGNDDPFTRRTSPGWFGGRGFDSPVPVGRTLDMVFDIYAFSKPKPGAKKQSLAMVEGFSVGLRQLSITDDAGRVFGISAIKTFSYDPGVRLAIREGTIRLSKELHVSMRLVSYQGDCRISMVFRRKGKEGTWRLSEGPGFEWVSEPNKPG